MGMYNTKLDQRTITDLKDDKIIIGNSICEYEINEIDNVTNLGWKKEYILTVRQKITLPPNETNKPNSLGRIDQYNNYPTVINNVIFPKCNDEYTTFSLLSISPKTASSSTNTSTSYSSSTTTGEDSIEDSVVDGSNYLDTNTYDLNISGNKTLGSSTSDLSSISIKDWSVNGREIISYNQEFTDSNESMVAWTFSQKYPLDYLKYNQSSNDGNISDYMSKNYPNMRSIELPSYVQAQMFTSSNNLVLPPSDLSLFGIDIIVEGVWLIQTFNREDLSISVEHNIELYNGSHGLYKVQNNSTFIAMITNEDNVQKGSYTVEDLNLTQYSLNPITDMASINIQKGKFLYKPTTKDPNSSNDKTSTPSTNTTTEFKIISREKDLQVVGNNFYSNLTPMYMPYYNTTPDNNNPTPEISSLDLCFKISDLTKEYNLYLIHWINEDTKTNTITNCQVVVTINNKELDPRIVDSLEGKGGKNNLDVFHLRNLDFTSKDFNDYLTLGLNKINIKFYSASSSPKASYTLYSLAIG